MSTEQLSQKQAVINAVASVLGTSFESGSTDAKSAMSDDQLETVRNTVYEGITNGTVAFGKSLDDLKAVRRYVNGMVDNHLRKATELNGGNRYTPTSTGTRRKASQSESNIDTSILPEDLQELVSSDSQ